MSNTSLITKTKSFIWNNLTLILILFFAFILRLPYLNGSFWLDEAAQALESTRPLSQQFDIIPDFQPPLLHLITHFASYFSYGEWWLRLWGAVIPGLITVWATYQIGIKLFSRKTAIISSLLLATSSFHIFFSQELRPYSLPAMWTLLSALIISNLITNHKTANTKNLVLFIIVNILGLFSSYLYPFFLIAQFVYLLAVIFIRTKKSKKHKNLNIPGNKNNTFSLSQLFIAGISITLLFAPWLPMFFKQLSAGQLLRTQMPNWETVVSISQIKTLPLLFGKFIFGVINIDINVAFVSISFIIISLSLALLVYFFKTAKSDHRTSFIFLTVISLVTVITAFIVSFWIPVIRPKRLLMLQPLLYLILAALSTNSFEIEQSKVKNDLLPGIMKYFGIILITILFSANIYSTHQLYFNDIYQREDWRDLHQEITAFLPKDDMVLVFSFPDAFSPWVWYNQREIDTLSTGYYYISDNPDIIQTLKPITNYKYVLVFDYLRDLTDPNDILIDEIEKFGYTSIGVLDKPNIGFVRMYSKEEIRI